MSSSPRLVPAILAVRSSPSRLRSNAFADIGLRAMYFLSPRQGEVPLPVTPPRGALVFGASRWSSALSPLTPTCRCGHPRHARGGGILSLRRTSRSRGTPPTCRPEISMGYAPGALSRGGTAAEAVRDDARSSRRATASVAMCTVGRRGTASVPPPSEITRSAIGGSSVATRPMS